MAPEHLQFGGGAAGTLLHPLVAVQLLITILLIFGLPRKQVIGPFLAGAFLIPLGQVVVLGGLHFTVLRVLILMVLARKAASPRAPRTDRNGRAKSLDLFVTLWLGTTLVASCLEFMDSQAVVKLLGDFLDALGGYFAVRFLIQDRADMRQAIKAFAVLTAVSGCFMINEHLTGQNVFGFLGGAPLHPQIRDGKLRAQAAFGVYIDAGVFGASLIPLFIWLWSDAKSRAMAALGMAGGFTMMFASNSSTPLLAFFGSLIALLLWHAREWMGFLRRAIALTLIGLHLVMNGPVWSLIARVDLTGSSSGYHRYYLVDNCIRHFTDWCLIGYKDYPNWGWDMWDLSDQYVAVALCGGLGALVVFIWLLSRSFGQLGTARKYVRGNRREEWFVWCLGATLLAHVVGWFGCSYMAQMQILLFSLLAMISLAIKETLGAPTVGTGKGLASGSTLPLSQAEELYGAAFS